VKVIVYVEGPSDKLAMERLLEPLLRKASEVGVMVIFIPISPMRGRGNSKRELMFKTPPKAVNILRNDPDAIAVAMPDLYPRNAGGLPHETFPELEEQIQALFKQALAKKHIEDEQINRRFRVFCFKHDLEALVLAAEEQLASRLGISSVVCTWIRPVENQNFDHPPKRIVERIFTEHGDRYQDTVDAPLILGASDYSVIAERCPQCFKPFVEYIESLAKGAR
jgi:hypothetical protein